MQHNRSGRLPRHCHREAFSALVLQGGYTEAGDRGRLQVGPGDVVFHGPYESHLDLFAPAGAQVLVLPCESWRGQPDCGRAADPDFLARIAERDPVEAGLHLMAELVPSEVAECDWPDRLARDLRANPDLGLHAWADAAGLRCESLSRGFRRVYGITPMAFRARVRTLKALSMLARNEALATIAAICRFADQSHMTRSIHALTGMPPREWRKSNCGAG
jgi:AraC-like DNA-binding protein